MHDPATAVILSITSASAYIAADVIAQLPPDAPSWMQYAFGPFGAMVVLIVVLIGVIKRWDKAQELEVKRQDSREKLLTEMTAANVRIADALERNTEVLSRVEDQLHR